MSFVQILSAFRLYGADVLLLAFGVTLTTSLLKKTVMKNFDKKIFVFLPFVLGFVYYAVYRMIATASVAPLGADFVHTLECGFGCGCAATLYYVIYEQFLRGKEVSPLAPLLECVPDERREAAAKALYEGAKDLDEEEMRKYFSEHLKTYADPPMSEEELLAMVELLTEYMMSLRG